MNADVYISLLESKLPQFMAIGSYEVFQQDGAPCHTARKVSKWFKDNGIEVLEWPGQSPDMNPIENLWRLLKIKVAQKHAKSLDDLQAIIKTVWCTEVSQELCLNLVHSMPARMQAVIKSKGAHTKY